MAGFALLLASAGLGYVRQLPTSATPCASVGHRPEAQSCFQALTQMRDAYDRAEGLWGLDRYDDANAEFRAAVAQNDKSAPYRVRWGRLLHERFNDQDAQNPFQGSS